jgi:hypothetical protein
MKQLKIHNFSAVLLALFTALAGLMAASATVQAQGVLGFSPQRVIMDSRARSASLTLTNRGKSTASYRIEMVDVIYQSNGRVKHVRKAPAGFPSAKRYIRFSPRQVRLRPGQSQTIRVLLRRKARKLPAGEYRVHALLRTLPDVSKLKVPKPRAGAVAGVIGVAQAVALPIIVRRGKTQATGRIAALKVKGGRIAKLDLHLARQGNRSLYTDLKLKNRAGKQVNIVKGVAVPVPNRQRRYLFAVPGISSKALRSGGYILEMVDHASGKVYSAVKVR